MGLKLLQNLCYFAQVLEQSDNGWWLVEIDGNKGWAPASYLELSNDNKNSTAEISKLGLSSSSSHLLTSSPNRDHASLSPRFPSQNVRPLSTGAPPYTSTGGRRSPSPTPLRNPPTFLGSDSNPATTTNRPGRPVSPAFNKRPPQKHLSEGRKSLPKVPPEKPYQKQEMEASVSWYFILILFNLFNVEISCVVRLKSTRISFQRLHPNIKKRFKSSVKCRKFLKCGHAVYLNQNIQFYSLLLQSSVNAFCIFQLFCIQRTIFVYSFQVHSAALIPITPVLHPTQKGMCYLKSPK